MFAGGMAAGEAVSLGLDARELAPGVYVVRVTGGAFSASRRVAVVR